MKFKNMTPHDIVIEKVTGEEVVFPSSGETIRVTKEEKGSGTIDGIKMIYQAITGINVSCTLEIDTTYIVSSMVMDAIKEFGGFEKYSFAAPDTNNAKRNDKGHIVSVPALVFNF